MQYEFEIQLNPLMPEKKYDAPAYGFECAIWAKGLATLSFWVDDDGMENAECSIEALNIETEFTCAGERIEALCGVAKNVGAIGAGNNTYAELERQIIAAYYDAQEQKDLNERRALGLRAYKPDFAPIIETRITIYEQTKTV